MVFETGKLRNVSLTVLRNDENFRPHSNTSQWCYEENKENVQDVNIIGKFVSKIELLSITFEEQLVVLLIYPPSIMVPPNRA